MGNLDNLKVLYVEDEKFTRMLVKKLLEKENIAVSEAANGVLGLKKYYEMIPDLIITDLAMPEMDGFEMIAKIRDKNPTIPIIVTTAYREEADRACCMVNDCIFKPIIKDDLIRAIEKIILK